MTPAEPVHTGVRPLSPHGEGYCRWCFFVVGLDHDGLLTAHERNGLYEAPKTCKGSGTRPPKVTPYASRKAAFLTRSPREWCPTCCQTVNTRTWTRSGRVFVRHFRFPGDQTLVCPMSDCTVGSQQRT